MRTIVVARACANDMLIVFLHHFKVDLRLVRSKSHCDLTDRGCEFWDTRG